MATHYQVLGVHSQSELASIRSAYLSLMKRFHPDHYGPGGGEVDVYRINLAWSVLRDDARRAEYDAELLHYRMRASPMPKYDRRVPVIVPRRHADPPGRTTVLLMTCAALACLVSSDVLRPRARAMTPALTTSPLSAGPARAAMLPMVEVDTPSLDPGIEDAVAMASHLNIQDAVNTSLNCYGSVTRGKAPEFADRCIAFDLAFAYWHDGEFIGRPLESYFLPGRQQLRHEQALSILSTSAGGIRLEAIRAKTFSTLVDILAARSGERREPVAADWQDTVDAPKLSQ